MLQCGEDCAATKSQKIGLRCTLIPARFRGLLSGQSVLEREEVFCRALRGPAREGKERTSGLSAPAAVRGGGERYSLALGLEEAWRDWDTNSSLQTSRERWSLVPPSC